MDAPPTLVAVLMGDDPASETYVEMKRRDCEEVGIDGRVREVDGDASQDELLDVVDELNADPDVDGVIVQLPLPDHVDERAALRAVDPAKDVDGFHPENKGLLMQGDPRFVPATPKGVQRMLVAEGYPVAGKDVVILGRSDIVGKPLANLLLQKPDGDGGGDESDDAGGGEDATVTVCHSATEDVAAHTRRADILVAAVGVPEFVNADMVTEDTVVVDVGVNRVERDGESTLVGDVAFDEVADVVEAISPVPGGVGPMTRAMLLENTVEAARQRRS
jgi:methylenetetrahydrofolate dehydrogenase (NADP+)/methenyltetrahydrofolate cyclohydrolase